MILKVRPDQKLYHIGGLSVYMTEKDAQAWNRAEITTSGLRRSIVVIPTTNRGLPCSEYITLRRASGRNGPFHEQMMDEPALTETEA